MLKFLCIFALLSSMTLSAQEKKKEFKWVNNSRNLTKYTGVEHHTFKSDSMGIDVGYCIYLPPQYKTDKTAKFPVVYYLHGGRPGSEAKSVHLSEFVHKATLAQEIKPMIYVFVNGGPVSHYNYPEKKNALGEDVFIKELIPHIDATYRTLAERKKRGLEGFSQGGRGTARIMFKHSDLFYSASPGGGGFATEKRISESGGKESESLIFAKGYNAYDLARKYKKTSNKKLRILFHVGTKGFNYTNNLEYMKFMDTLEIPYEKEIVEGVPHSALRIYQKSALRILKFHSSNFYSK